ncbi:MAG TPA: CHAP domain-containing protein [Acidimicrobiales bacterium]|nr:CHAP domain-containing protein [Acidimicrobiales bacterium]
MFQRKTGHGRGRAQWSLTVLALGAGFVGGAIALETPVAYAASAGPSAGPLCEGFTACGVAPYTNHNFQSEYKTSYWGMPPDQDTAPSGAWANCTNYVAFVESTVYGVPTPKPALPVNATNWATGAGENGLSVSQTPTVGSVAQWYANDHDIGRDGHVAVVEAVGPNDSYIVVSQDNWSSDTDYYGWALILAGTASQGEPWPDNFIHFPGTRLPATLAYTQPDRLVQSTGNLYWTADQTLDGVSYADVIRASKGNEPGQERVLYQQSQPANSMPVDFEAITYADVGGTWYGYFVANYQAQDESEIVRVPLAGGAAVVLADSPAFIGNRDLLTDGPFLYWADANGIRKMAIAGGPIETLVPGETFAHLGLDGPVLYYSSGNNIVRIPTSGGTPTTVVSASSAITGLYPPSATNGNVYWGEVNGAVCLFPGPHGSAYQLQAPGAGVSVTSVSVAGNYILWGERMPQGYKVDGYDNGNIVPVPAAGPPVDVQGDAGAWYWGGADLEKFTL